MKRITLFILLNMHMTSVLFGNYMAPTQRPCETTEQALLYEISKQGMAETVEDHVKTARVYKSMAYRGCKDNSEMYKQYSRASLEAAKAMAEIEADLTGRDKLHYDTLINKAVIRY